MTLLVRTFSLVTFVLSVSARNRFRRPILVPNDSLVHNNRILPQYLEIQPGSAADLGMVCTHHHCFSQKYMFLMHTAREDYDEAVTALGITLERFMQEFPLYDENGPPQDMFRRSWSDGDDKEKRHVVTIKLATLMPRSFQLLLVLVNGTITSCFIEESGRFKTYVAAVEGYKDDEMFCAVYQGQALTIQGTSNNLVRKGLMNEEYALYHNPHQEL